MIIINFIAILFVLNTQNIMLFRDRKNIYSKIKDIELIIVFKDDKF